MGRAPRQCIEGRMKSSLCTDPGLPESRNLSLFPALHPFTSAQSKDYSFLLLVPPPSKRVTLAYPELEPGSGGRVQAAEKAS
jgi:hypothetical protein